MIKIAVLGITGILLALFLKETRPVFAAGICKDAGYGAISSQIEFFGKISVLATGTPVLLALFETIRSCLA